jgi:hypothetical protein
MSGPELTLEHLDGTALQTSCPRCGRRRWWRLRTGQRICMRCCPDPLQALASLVRNGSRIPRRAKIEQERT